MIIKKTEICRNHELASRVTLGLETNLLIFLCEV